MRVLVAVASHHGGSREIAEAVAEKLRDRGHTVDLHDAGDPINVPFYDAAILGSSVYYRSWLPAAAELVRRNIGALSRRPTWLFSVGATSRGNTVISGWQ